MESYQEYLIQGKKVHVIDNAMPQPVVDRWVGYYENSATFRMIGAESLAETDVMYWMASTVDLKTRYEIFDIESWLMPMVTRFNPECTVKEFMRSYINLSTSGDRSKGHQDTEENFADTDGFFTASVLFANPHVKDSADCGFEFEGGLYVENVFNRLIIFDGTLWHRAHVPTDNLVRLTLYNSFRKPRIVSDYTKSPASWFK